MKKFFLLITALFALFFTGCNNLADHGASEDGYNVILNVKALSSRTISPLSEYNLNEAVKNAEWTISFLQNDQIVQPEKQSVSQDGKYLASIPCGEYTIKAQSDVELVKNSSLENEKLTLSFSGIIENAKISENQSSFTIYVQNTTQGSGSFYYSLEVKDSEFVNKFNKSYKDPKFVACLTEKKSEAEPILLSGEANDGYNNDQTPYISVLFDGQNKPIPSGYYTLVIAFTGKYVDTAEEEEIEVSMPLSDTLVEILPNTCTKGNASIGTIENERTFYVTYDSNSKGNGVFQTNPINFEKLLDLLKDGNTYESLNNVKIVLPEDTHVLFNSSKIASLNSDKHYTLMMKDSYEYAEISNNKLYLYRSNEISITADKDSKPLKIVYDQSQSNKYQLPEAITLKNSATVEYIFPVSLVKHEPTHIAFEDPEVYAGKIFAKLVFANDEIPTSFNEIFSFKDESLAKDYSLFRYGTDYKLLANSTGSIQISGSTILMKDFTLSLFKDEKEIQSENGQTAQFELSNEELSSTTLKVKPSNFAEKYEFTWYVNGTAVSNDNILTINLLETKGIQLNEENSILCTASNGYEMKSSTFVMFVRLKKYSAFLDKFTSIDYELSNKHKYNVSSFNELKYITPGFNEYYVSTFKYTGVDSYIAILSQSSDKPVALSNDYDSFIEICEHNVVLTQTKLTDLCTSESLDSSKKYEFLKVTKNPKDDMYYIIINEIDTTAYDEKEASHLYILKIKIDEKKAVIDEKITVPTNDHFLFNRFDSSQNCSYLVNLISFFYVNGSDIIFEFDKSNELLYFTRAESQTEVNFVDIVDTTALIDAGASGNIIVVDFFENNNDTYCLFNESWVMNLSYKQDEPSPYEKTTYARGGICKLIKSETTYKIEPTLENSFIGYNSTDFIELKNIEIEYNYETTNYNFKIYKPNNDSKFLLGPRQIVAIREDELWFNDFGYYPQEADDQKILKGKCKSRLVKLNLSDITKMSIEEGYKVNISEVADIVFSNTVMRF